MRDHGYQPSKPQFLETSLNTGNSWVLILCLKVIVYSRGLRRMLPPVCVMMPPSVTG